jgi:phosphoribosylformimino-5-aminoimidazole carboxamide ribotide isomerase
LIVAVDARKGMIATHGWQRTSTQDAVSFCRDLRDQGVARVLYTDVDRDGMLEGPNIERTRAIAQVLAVLASGGVSAIEHLRQLGAAGAEGAIIGTARYTGQLQLRDALAAAC